LVLLDWNILHLFRNTVCLRSLFTSCITNIYHKPHPNSRLRKKFSSQWIIYL